MQNINTLRPRQNGRHFADDIFKRIFLNENIWIPIKISLKFFPKGSINYIPALVQIMAWCRPGDKPLSEPMMVNLPTHICVTRPQWVKDIENRKCQDYVYIKWEYWSTMQKIKHYLGHGNKVNENKVSYCKALKCDTIKNIKKLLSCMSSLETYYQFKLDFQKVYQHKGGKWLIHGTKRYKDNQLESLELPCRIS